MFRPIDRLPGTAAARRVAAVMLVAVAAALPPVHAQTAPPTESADVQAQRDAMARLAWMAGEWRGESTMQRGPTASRTLSWERVTAAAGGLALLVQGRHHLPDAAGRPGELVHDAAGMISYDPATGRYRFVTQLATGRSGSFEARVEDGRFVWFIPAGPATIRYEIARDGDRGWNEQGVHCPAGASAGAPAGAGAAGGVDACQRFFTMQLERQ